MDYWSPGSSNAHTESDHLQPFNIGDEYSEHYGIGIMPPDNLSSFQQSLAPADIFNDVTEPNIKHEYEYGYEPRSMSIPSSINTQHSDASIPPNTKTRVTKSRRNMSTSSDSTSASQPSTEVSREKNRIAASKCRRKKKASEQQLEERRRMLQVQNTILQDSAAQLRDEVLHLKNEILKHGTCEYPPIQNYIRTAAARLC